MKKRAVEPARTGIRVRHLEGRRNDDPILEISNEILEEESLDVLPQSNVQTDKLRLRIFEGMQKSNQRSEQQAAAWQNQPQPQRQPSQTQHVRQLSDYNREPQPAQETVKIGEPVRLPDPLRLTSNGQPQPRPQQPTNQPNPEQSKSKLTIQMPNMQPSQSNNVHIDSLQNFLKQPPQLRQQLLQQMNPQKGNEEPIRVKPLVVYGEGRAQQSLEQQQTRIIQPPNMQALQPQLQPFQPNKSHQLQRTPVPAMQQSIQEQLSQQSIAHQTQQPATEPNNQQISQPQCQPQVQNPPVGMLVSLRDPQIKTQRASEQLDAQLMKRVDGMQKQIEQLTSMLAEKDKRQQLADQRLDEVLRLKESELEKKDSEIAKHLLTISELQTQCETKNKQLDSLRYQLVRAQRGEKFADTVHQHPARPSNNNASMAREIQIRKQQQHLDELQRSKGDSLVFEQSLFNRQKRPQPQAQQPRRLTSQFEVRWNSEEWNQPSPAEQEYLSPLAVNMNTRRPLEIEDSKRFRFEDLQDMSDLEF